MADPLFQGLTRPAMKLGVPLTPLIMVIGAFILLSTYTSFFVMLGTVPAVLVMRLIVSEDDRAFHILWLDFLANAPAAGKRKLGKVHIYNPFPTRSQINGKKR